MVDEPRVNDGSRVDDDDRERDHGRRRLSRDADLASPESRERQDNKKDRTPNGLPRVELVRSLSGEGLDEAASKLRDAVKHENTFGLNDAPQESRIRAILEPLSKNDRQALERKYDEKFNPDGEPGQLRRDLDEKLNETEFRKAEAILNREDNRANDAGELKVALAENGDDKTAGNAKVLQIFSTLNSRDIALMREDFQKHYGESMDEALKNADLPDSTRKALGILMKGSDRREAKDNIELANLAAEAGDQTLLSVALRGDSDAARGAREKLKENPEFKDQLEKTFPGNKVVQDYLEEGRISLKTIADESQGGFLGIGENKDNFELALKNISESERKLFLEGKKWNDAKQCPTNEKEQEALDYYKKIHDGLNDLGDDREVSRWEDMIRDPNGTLITRMADQHEDHDKVFAAVETMSEADWKRLTDKEGGAQYRKDLEESASHYLNGDEEGRLARLLDDKLNAPTYEASRQVSQPLLDILDEGDAGKIADRIMHLNPQDRERYQDDAGFRGQVDEKLKGIDGEGGVLVRHLMDQVKADGSLPQLDPVNQVLYDKVKNAPPGQFLKDAQIALEDPALREKLQKNENLTERESALRTALSDFLSDNGNQSAMAGRGGYGGGTPHLDDLLEDGRLSLSVQKELDVPMSYLYSQLPQVSEDERNDFVDDLEDDQKTIAEKVIAQDGKLTLADQMRSYIVDGGTQFKTFIEPLEQMRGQPGALEELKKEYADKYGRDLADDFGDKLGADDERTLLDLLDPNGIPVREDFYHVLNEHNESGINIDGTEMTMQRAVDEFAIGLERYQSQFKDMPEEERRKLNEFFAEAQEQYKQSKEAFAKFVVNAVLIGGAVVAAPFTGGMSLAGVAAIAAAGAAFRTGATWAIEGDDFDSGAGNILKQSLIGAGQAGFSFLGPSAIAGATSIGKEAAENVASTLASAEGKNLLKAGAEQTLNKELQTLYLNSTVRGEAITQRQFADIAAKVAKNPEDVQSITTLLKQSTTREITQASEKHLLNSIKYEGREAAFNGGSAAALNVTSNVLMAPLQGLNAEQLKDSVVMGTVGGSIIGPAFKGIFRPAQDDVEQYLGTSTQIATRKAFNHQLSEDGGGRLLTRLRSGDRVSFGNEPGWKVKGFDQDGNLILTHDVERQVSIDELRNVNRQEFKQKGLQPGAHYAI
jgi:hypothetical protein